MKRNLYVVGSVVLSALLLAGCGASMNTATTMTKASPVIATTANTATSPVMNSTTTAKTETKGDLDVYFLNVGQGDSTLIITPQKNTILIDGGNPEHGKTVVNDLKKYGVNEIDIMIATHPDSDHIGGLSDVLKTLPVQSVYAPKITHNTKTYENFIRAVKNRGLKINVAKAGVTLPMSGVDAELVGPVKDYGEDTNPWSAVLRLQYGDNSFLFTGDAPVESEHDMIASGENLKADVLKVGHHGSDTASSQAFLKAVAPQYAVISVGKDNPYHLPHPSTLTKLKKDNIKFFRTDEQGTIEAISNGQNIAFKTNQ